MKVHNLGQSTSMFQTSRVQIYMEAKWYDKIIDPLKVCNKNDRQKFLPDIPVLILSIFFGSNVRKYTILLTNMTLFII